MKQESMIKKSSLIIAILFLLILMDVSLCAAQKAKLTSPSLNSPQNPLAAPAPSGGYQLTSKFLSPGVTYTYYTDKNSNILRVGSNGEVVLWDSTNKEWMNTNTNNPDIKAFATGNTPSGWNTAKPPDGAQTTGTTAPAGAPGAAPAGSQAGTTPPPADKMEGAKMSIATSNYKYEGGTWKKKNEAGEWEAVPQDEQAGLTKQFATASAAGGNSGLVMVPTSVTVKDPNTGQEQIYRRDENGNWVKGDTPVTDDATKKILDAGAKGQAAGGGEGQIFNINGNMQVAPPLTVKGTAWGDYTRTSDGIYTFTDTKPGSSCYQVTCKIDVNTGEIIDASGGRHDLNNPVLLDELKRNNDQWTELKKGGKDPSAAKGPGGTPLNENTNFEKMKWEDVKKQIAMTGWFDWLTGGPITGNLNTIGASWFGESFTGGGQDAYNAIKNSMTINAWAERICRYHLNNAGGTRGILTSPSGMSYAHAEGEYTEVEPCAGQSYNASCKKYYAYKISAEISAGEVPMTFNIVLGPKNTNLYPADVILTKGQLLSLSGPSMFYWESYDLYTTICIQFTDTTNLETLFGAQFDNPICQPISEGAPREYQGYLTQTGPGATPMPTPGGPVTPGSVPPTPGGSATTPRPGLGG